jgi:hypothetical protein
MGCLALMLAPFALGFVIPGALLLRSLSLELYSTTYPSVMGTITTRGVESVKYAYELDGRTFQGDNFRYSMRSESDSAAWAGPEFRVGSPVRVYYRRGAPWESVLVPGVQGRTLQLLLGFAPVNLAIAMGLFLMVRSARKSRLEVRAFERNGRTHVRLTDRTPFLVGLAGASATSLLLCLVLGTVTGGEPPLSAALLAWAFVVAAGVLANRWWQARLDTGLYDLILDEQARTLSLPATYGRGKRRDLEWSAIQGVILEKETRRSKQGNTSENFSCMLRLAEGSRVETVHEWQGDPDRAANLVNWLQARLGLDESTLVPRPAPTPAPKKKKVRY